MSEPTRIVFGITELNVGGAEKSLVEVVTRLDKSRWAMSVVSLQPLGPLADVLRDNGIPVESLEMTSLTDVWSGLHGWTSLLRRTEPAAVVSFLFHANILGRVAAKKAGVPVHISSVRVAERSAQWQLFMDATTSRMTDRYVCVSESVAKFTRKAVCNKPAKISVIPNGVDLSLVDQATPIDAFPWNIEPGDLVLAFVGRLCRQKGPDVLLEALSSIPRFADELNLRVVMIGNGPMKEELESTARALELQRIVRFVGWQPDVLGWLLRSQGLVLSSRWEGMPNVVLEAMACRRPVISTSVDGATELVRPGQTGWLIGRENPTVLADAIAQWMQDAGRRTAFGEEGRLLVEQHFRVERMVDDWDKLLTEMTSNARRR